MKIDPLNGSDLIICSSNIGTETRGMVRKRAGELALINGREKKDMDEALMIAESVARTLHLGVHQLV